METAAPVAPASPAAPAPSAPASIPAAGEVGAPDKPVEGQPERTFTQKELDEIIEKRLGKERRKREDIERRLKITEELHLKGRDSQPVGGKPAEPEGSKEPSREQFDSYEAFIEARAEWRAEKAADKRFEEREKKSREDAQKKTQAEQAEAFRKRMRESAKGLEDFDDVLADATRDPSAPVSRIFSDALDAVDQPGRVLYELAKNQDEAERIAALPLARQARELMLLEGKLSKQQPQRSQAPAPIDPVGGKGSAATDEITGDESPAEFKRKREAQLRKRGGR